MPRTQPEIDQDINSWVERCTRYSTLVDESLDPLREGLSRTIFTRLYEEQSALWIEEQRANPHLIFQPGDQLAQAVFFQKIDAICATFDTVDKADWKALLRISFAAQAGSLAIGAGENQFPASSPLNTEMRKRITANMQVINAKAINARREREAAEWSRWCQAQDALQKPDPPTQGISLKPPRLGPDVDESVTYFHGETDELHEFVVLCIRRHKQGGIWYTVAYVGSEDTEVELSEHEMKDILNRSVSIKP